MPTRDPREPVTRQPTPKPAPPPHDPVRPPTPAPKAPKPAKPAKVAAPPALIGKNPLEPHDPINKAVAQNNDPNFAQKQARRAAENRRRQTILKGLGLYKGMVDGIWGKQSQDAWSIYVDRRRNGKLGVPFLSEQQVHTQEAKAARASHVSQMRQNARVSRETGSRITAGSKESAHDNIGRDNLIIAKRAAADVRASLARESKHNVEIMHQLRTDPTAASRIGLHQLTAAVIDKSTGWSVSSKTDVLVIQRWLNTHGQAVALSGKFDQSTNDALKRAYDHERVAAHDRAIHTVVERFYGGGYHAGDHPSWWNGPGPVPAPGELLKTLQAGGFRGDMLIRQILANIDVPQTDYQVWRRDQLKQMLTTYREQFDAPNWIAAGGSIGVTAANILARANRVLSPRAQATFKAQLDTLVDSRSGDEFSRRIASAIRIADRQYEVEQAKRAHKDPTWWGEAISTAFTPLAKAEEGVTFAKTAFIADYYQAADLVTEGHLRADSSEYWRAASDAQKNAPVGIRLANTWIADPLIFLRPFRIASTTLKYGMRVFHIADEFGLGGYKTASAAGKLGVLSRRVEYTDAEWHLPIRAGGATILRRVPGVDNALALKTVAIDKAQGAVVQAGRHAFAAPRKAFAQLGKHESYQGRVSAKTRAMLNEARADLVHQIEKNNPALVGALKTAKSSLYLDAHRRTLSDVGASLIARQAEEIRVQEVHRLANHYSQDVFERAINGGYTEAQHSALLIKHGVEPLADGAAGPARRYQAAAGRSDKSVTDFKHALAALRVDHPAPIDLEAARARALEEYHRVKAGAGLFISGAGDAELTAVIDKRVATQLEQWKEVQLPAMQDVLEIHYANVGEDLWDESGLWASRNDVAALELSGIARESFDASNLIEVPNPLYGVEMTFSEALPIIEGEVRRRQARVMGWAARKEIGDDELRKLLAKERADVEDAFVEHGGKFTDTRPTLMVSDIYARDHVATFDFLTPRWAEGAAHVKLHAQNALAVAPKVANLTRVDYEIGLNTWNLGTMHADITAMLGAGTDPTARRFSMRGMPAKDAEKMMERAARYRQAVQKYHIALGAATEQALPYALKENGALMVALSHAQSLPFRVLYKALDGAMNTWIFATLPLRSGWVVRNVFDNALKTFIAGVHDPRAYFRPFAGGHVATAIGTGLEHVVSIFDAGMGQLLEAVRFIDGIFGTNAATHFETILDTFWANQLDTIERVFKTQGWDVPKEVLEGARLNPFQRRAGAGRLTKTSLFNPDELEKLPAEYQAAYAKHFKDNVFEANKMQRFRDGMWHLMANTPENYYKKVIYNDTVRKLRAQGMTAMEAHDRAWAKVEATLFDYSKITVVEDNLRVFLPFIQFWRKNTGLWARNFATKPWLTVEMNNYIRERDQLHDDWPEWMKRYVNVQEITDAAAVIPGLGWLATAALPNDGQFDPLSFASFSPYYRAFKDENPTLPADQAGTHFFGPMIDAMNDWGLGMSPFFRKPLESAHIASERSWQTVFPQTSLASAITRKFWGDTAAGYVMDWERIFTLFQGRTPSDQIAQNFEFYVRRAMENQLARGEQSNRAAAEAETRTWFLAQNVWGYFGGVYFRKNSPEDFFTAKLQDQVITGKREYADLTQREKSLLQVWKLGGIDKATGRLRIDKQAFDRYVESVPLIEAFYSKSSYAAGAKFLQDHPEIVQYVDPKFTKGRYYGVNYAKAAAMYLHGADWFNVDRLLTELNLPYDMKKAAASIFITPELEAFWTKNDTPADQRRKMLAGELHGYMNDLNEAYWAIPETDAAARSGFLDEHPELARSWQHNNTNADDYHAILNGAKADLREVYFATVREHGFAAAAAFLKQFAFMFDGTSAESKLKDGAWIRRSTAHSRAYVHARSALDYYFKLRDSGNKAAASAWLHSDSALAKIARDYFRDWGHGSRHGGTSLHAQDYLRARRWLSLYFNMAQDARIAWLNGKSPGAVIVKRYFQKWGHHKGMSAHARDYLAAKSALNHYFSLDKAARDKWLRGGSKEAAAVLDYFKKYSTTAKLERAFLAAGDGLSTTNPELRRRMQFWRNYYALSPAERPAYVHDHAESFGIFVFGALGDAGAHDREQQFIRAAMAAKITVNGSTKHLSERQATYLYVKPLLNQLYAIPKKDRGMFIDANPELADYLAAYSHKTLTGDAGLDAKIEWYFSLPQGSKLRSDALVQYPEIQAYFSQHSTPAQRAILSLLEVFFKLSGKHRNAFKLEHPEIQAYFDRRKLERAMAARTAGAFEQADPRLRDYFSASAADLGPSAERMRGILREAHIRQYTPDGLSGRRDRQPVDPATGKPVKIPTP